MSGTDSSSTAISVVMFDFQDTLARYRDSHYALYVQAAADHGVTVDQGAFSAPADDAWADFQTPAGIDHSAHSTDEATFHVVRRELHEARLLAAGVRGELSAIAERIIELEQQPQQFRLFDDVVPALDRIAAAGLRMAIVSNHVWGLPAIVQALGIGGYFAAVLTSSQVGYRKPHPAIYRAALATLDVAPAAVLFVGDSPTGDVRGPRAVGMRAVLLDRGAAPQQAAPPGTVEDRVSSLLELPLPGSDA